MPAPRAHALFARGRGFGFGLFAVVAAGAACADPGPGPVSDAAVGSVEARTEEVDGTWTVSNAGPRETLRIYEQEPEGPAQLLFMEGRGAAGLDDGGAAWPDLEGGRVLILDRFGFVQDILQGAPADGRLLARPAFAVPGPNGGVVAVEADGSALLFEDGQPVSWSEPEWDGPLTGGESGTAVATRTVLEFELGPLRRRDALLWVRDTDGDVTPMGKPAPAAEPFLSHLVNAGWSTVAPGGAIYHASALRPELLRFEPDGTSAWTSRWTPDRPPPKPYLKAVEGQVTPVFQMLQQAIAIGPDGRIYVLSAPSAGQPRVALLLVFEPTGVLLRVGQVPARHAIFAARSGHVYVLPPDRVLSRTDTPQRIAFEPFRVPALGDGPDLRLDEHAGKVVVVNFWASWCGPCRREMPELAEYARGLDPSRVVVLGLNEDVAPENGLRFLDEIGGVRYANGRGEGKLKARYNYRGLPYTVVLDQQHREVKRIYGFGTSIDPVREAVEAALDEG